MCGEKFTVVFMTGNAAALASDEPRRPDLVSPAAQSLRSEVFKFVLK